MSVRGVLARLVGAAAPDPMATMPSVEPVATPEDDGTIKVREHVPKLDPASLHLEHKGKGHFVVRGIMWVRPRKLQWLTQNVVFDLHLPEAADGELRTSYDDPTLTIRVPPQERTASETEPV
jgi:hypothetical protein